MTAQGVLNSPGNALQSVLMGFATPDTAIKGAAGNSFEELMTASKEQDTTAYTPEKSTAASKQENSSANGVQERAKEFFTGEGKIKEARVPVAKENPEQSEEAVEAVSVLLVQIQTVLCETLDISEEELSQAMDALDLEPEVLLDRSGLQELFLYFNQETEPTELLTNEELFQQFSELLQEVEGLLQESGLSAEEAKDILKESGLFLQAENEDVPEEMLVSEAVVSEYDDAESMEVSDESEQTQEAVPIKAQSEAKTDTGNSESKEASVDGKESKEVKIISSGQDAEVRNAFIDNLTNFATEGLGEEATEAAAQLRDIANQIMEQIKIVIKPEQTNMELQLNPEHLGRVNLTITEKEGMMTAQFTTQSEVAKEAIESQMSALRESLQNQGLKVEAIEVTVSEFGFERDREGSRNTNEESGKQKRRNGIMVDEAEEAMPNIAEFLNVSDSSVDYSA